MLWNKQKVEYVEYKKEKETDKIEIIEKEEKKEERPNIPKIPSKAVKKCLCEGTVHKIIANCIKCGKLYCSGNSELVECDFCTGFVADPRTTEYKVWFEESMKDPDFKRAMELRDKTIENVKNGRIFV